MTANLRLSPSGPQIGEMALMPLRVTEDTATPELAITLTSTPVVVDAALIASLAGPFNASHRLSVEAQVYASNSSTNTLAQVNLSVQARVDGGSWVDVYNENHNIGANSSVGEIGDDERQIRPVLIYSTPIALSSWGSPPADASLIEVRLRIAANAGETDTVTLEPQECWIRLTDHSSATDQPLRQPPSGPPVGNLDAAPLRVAADVASLGGPLTLTGSAQDVNSALRATLAGPFDFSHFFSAEAELDISNDDASTLAAVTLMMQVSWDNGSTWEDVAGANHNIGANAANAERQIRGCSIHITPRNIESWGTPPDDATSMIARVTATMTAGGAGNVQVEVQPTWLRLIEHSAPA